MDGISELAKMLKERETRPYMGPRVGEVVSPPPEIKVALEEGIILDKKHLVIAAHILNGYQREELIEGDIIITGAEGQATYVQPPPPDNPEISESWGFIGKTVEGCEKISGKITYTDTLKLGDKVILVPSTDEQTYFLVDKAVIL